MKFITDEQDLFFKSKIQSLYFYAQWMPFHKKMMVMIDKIEKKYSNIEFFAIDTDYFSTLCKRFKIESIPTVIIIKDGIEIKRINGLIMTSAFKSIYNKIINDFNGETHE